MGSTFWPVAWIASVIVISVASLLILFATPGDKRSSISRYISESKELFVIMGVLLTVCGGLSFGFITYWLVPIYELPWFTNYVVVIGFIALLGLAWIPDIDQPRRLSLHALHFACGGILGVCYILIMGICLTSNLPLVSRSITTFAVIFCSLNILLFFTSKFVKRYFLKLELASVALYFASITSLMFMI